jgi:hypothetical protein
MSRANLILTLALFALSGALVWAYFRPSPAAAAAVLLGVLMSVLAARR